MDNTPLEKTSSRAPLCPRSAEAGDLETDPTLLSVFYVYQIPGDSTMKKDVRKERQKLEVEEEEGEKKKQK